MSPLGVLAASLQDVLVEPVEQFVLPSVDWAAIAPNLILMLGGILLLTVVSVLKRRVPAWFAPVWTISAAVAAGCAVVPLWQRFLDSGPETLIGGAVGLDGFSLFATVVVCIS
ncbi:MAG: hypothetical protein FJW94_09775, partial [Actinobacteria bacterium]|nr:hypothetical protein [Actinomycetota bacterium]